MVHHCQMQKTLVGVDDDPNPKMPGAEILATFETHDEARRAAARMVENDFPPSQIVLVGFGFYMIEKVRGANHYAKVAKEWGTIGACFGLGYGLTAGGIYIPVLPPEFQFGGSILACLMVFGGLGMIVGIVKYSLKKDKEIIDSSEEFFATRYRIEVPIKHLARARRALEAEPTAEDAAVRE